jgi:hypothetical protein
MYNFFNAQPGGIYSDHWALKGQMARDTGTQIQYVCLRSVQQADGDIYDIN